MRRGRLVRVVVGYIAAMTAASFLILAPIALMQMLNQSHNRPSAAIFMLNFVYLGGAGAVAQGILALPGWIVMIVFAARRQNQTKGWFLLAGALSAAVPFAVIQTVGILLRSEHARGDDYRSVVMLMSDTALSWLVVGASGLFAGWVYWVISGRHLGSTKDVPAVTPGTPAGSSQ
jgi:hypothetical protein